MNLDFVVHQAAETVARLRREGKRVLVHCAAGQSRTPTVSAVYGARLNNSSFNAAWQSLARTLPVVAPNGALIGAGEFLAPGPGGIGA